MSISERPRAARPVPSATEAVIPVSDFDRSRDYYVSRLGFAVAFAHGDPPFHGLVTRGGARLCLRRVCEPVFAGEVREREQLLSAVFTLDAAAETEALFREYQAAAVDFFRGLETQPWGARTFVVRDPDGNLVLFAAPAG